MRNYLPFLLSLLFGILLGCKDEPVKAVDQPFVDTHDGYQIKFHRDAAGPTSQIGDLIYYHVRHRNGNTVTFSSRRVVGEPYSFMLNGVNPGVKVPPIMVGLMQMSPGDSATIRIDLENAVFKEPGYENAKFKDIDISLIKIEKGVNPVAFGTKQRLIEPKDFADDVGFNGSTEEANVNNTNVSRSEEMWNDLMGKKIKEVLFDLGNQYRAGQLGQSLIRLPSGVQYIELEKGSNKQLGFNKNVWLKYYGSNMEGRPFENKYKKDKVEEIALGSNQIVKGLEEGIAQLNEGGSGIFFIPPNLAFGGKGTKGVEPNAQFVVYYAKVERFY